MARAALLAICGAVVAALVLPLLFMVAEAVARGEGIVADDFRFAYTLGVPFALAVSLVVAWPADRAIPRRWTAASRLATRLAVGFAAPVVAIWPIAGEFPWKGGLAGMATYLLWAAAYRACDALTSRTHVIRSKPRG